MKCALVKTKDVITIIRAIALIRQINDMDPASNAILHKVRGTRNNNPPGIPSIIAPPPITFPTRNKAPRIRKVLVISVRLKNDIDFFNCSIK
jgi:hypothetical protein